ncbi:MAG: DUF1275 family protein [Phenylobacterium sp.]|uniref:DUF1275 family protein n=1 Tax=Phenylobacterium sp. TaxID=1871053 RepID=UPI003918B7B9
MRRLDRRARLFAIVLAAAAGYVDAAGFLMTGGFFVSFMSGNSTRLGVGLFRGAEEALIAGGLIAAFVSGVVIGGVLRRAVAGRPEAAILSVLTGALAGAGVLAAQGWPLPAALLLACAMGAENLIFAQGGEVRVGLTYMTGALVKVGKGLAAAIFGEDRGPWLPDLMLWAGLVAGAAGGAVAYGRLGAPALWPAAGAMAVLAALSFSVFPRGAAAEPSRV